MTFVARNKELRPVLTQRQGSTAAPQLQARDAGRALERPGPCNSTGALAAAVFLEALTLKEVNVAKA